MLSSRTSSLRCLAFRLLSFGGAWTHAQLIAPSPHCPFTVFAPNNEAFKTFFETSEITVAELLANPELGDILRRHVIKGRYTAADALALDPVSYTYLTLPMQWRV